MSEKEEKPIQKADEYAYNYWAMMAPTQKELKAWHEAGKEFREMNQKGK